ncbi:MAG: 3-deoxy-manno-octulosonate cytidylyltransferase [Pyrinomonadaceae bacterium]
MEQHGKNPSKNVIVIIPARYASMRLPGKLLLEIAGKPLILHTLGQALKATTVSRVIVATDDERIWAIVNESGGEAVMTAKSHRSGSDRAAEIAADLPIGSIIVNVQGDEPMISPETIDRAVSALVEDVTADLATTCEPIDRVEDVFNANVVKVVIDIKGYALYFSRSAIPYFRESAIEYGGLELAIREQPDLLSIFRKHTGLYAFRREFLLRFAKMKPTVLEQAEMLEQNRALENGARIKVVEGEGNSIGIDTSEDLERVRSLMARGV